MSHWVAVVRQFIHGKIHFFYSNDLNSCNIYESIHSLFSTSNTSERFHPKEAVWIKVHAFTYILHSNEWSQNSTGIVGHCYSQLTWC